MPYTVGLHKFCHDEIAGAPNMDFKLFFIVDVESNVHNCTIVIFNPKTASSFMRKLICLLGIILVLGMSGCFVLSVNPAYTESDLVFDSALIGNWGEKGQSEGITIEADDSTGYTLTSIEDSLAGTFDAHLFRLGETLFLDLYPTEPGWKYNETWMMHMVPTHSVYRVDRIEPELVLTPLDYDWLAGVLKEHPEKLKHADVQDYVLVTASTEPFREFLLQNAENPDAFGDNMTFKRVK